MKIALYSLLALLASFNIVLGLHFFSEPATSLEEFTTDEYRNGYTDGYHSAIANLEEIYREEATPDL